MIKCISTSIFKFLANRSYVTFQILFQKQRRKWWECARNLLLFAIFFNLASCSIKSVSPDEPAPPKIPESSNIRDIDGNHFLIPDPSAKGTLFFFVCSTCIDFKKQVAQLNAIHHKLKQNGIYFFAVSSDANELFWDIQEKTKRAGIEFPLIRDFDQDLMTEFKVKHQNEAVFLDKNRTVIFRGPLENLNGLKTHRSDKKYHFIVNMVSPLLNSGEASQHIVTHGPLITRRPRPEKYTYFSDVQPIISRYCIGCHVSAGAAPFALETYRQVWAMRSMIKLVLQENRMPPWTAHPGYVSIHGSRFLPEKEKKIILDWISTDAKAGKKENQKEKLAPAGEVAPLRNPDLVFDVHPPLKIKGDEGSVFRGYIVDPGFKEEVMITGVEFVPSAKKALHHMTMILIPPDDVKKIKTKKVKVKSNPDTIHSFELLDRTGSTLMLELARSSKAWNIVANASPNLYTNRYHDGMGAKVKPGWKLGFDMHLESFGKELVSSVRIKLKTSKNKNLIELNTAYIGNENFIIPAHARNHQLDAKVKLKEDIVMLAVSVHGHYRARYFDLSYKEPEKAKKRFFVIPSFDVNWQQSYPLKVPIKLKKGTELLCRAIYDNSNLNPVNPNPDAAVEFGFKKNDEMLNCYYIYYLPEKYN